MNTPTPTPRTDSDSEITFTGMYVCAEIQCFQCNARTAALTAERDQLRAENATLRAAQKACEACDEPTAFEVRQLRAELTAEREKSERYRLATLKLDAELTAELEKVGVLRSALENLCDEQNGAPLSTREEEWKQAMDGAEAALAATEAKP